MTDEVAVDESRFRCFTPALEDREGQECVDDRVHGFGAFTDPEGLIEVFGSGRVGLEVLQDLLVLLLVDRVDAVLAFVVEGVPPVPGDGDGVLFSIVALAGDGVVGVVVALALDDEAAKSVRKGEVDVVAGVVEDLQVELLLDGEQLVVAGASAIGCEAADVFEFEVVAVGFGIQLVADGPDGEVHAH